MLHLHASYNLRKRNLKSAKIVFSVVNQPSVMAGDGDMMGTGIFQTSIKQVCEERNDEWSQQVMGRISYASDLCAKNAVYHHQCSTNFRTGRGIPKQFNVNDAVSDKRPKLDEYQAALQERNEAFFFVARYVEENADEQVTVTELTKKMDDYLKETG